MVLICLRWICALNRLVCYMSYTRVDLRLQVGDLQPHAILPSRKAGDQWQHKGCSDQPRRLSCDHVLCRICRKRISDFPVTKASKTPKMGGRHSRHLCSETLMRDRSLRAKRSAIICTYIYITGIHIGYYIIRYIGL